MLMLFVSKMHVSLDIPLSWNIIQLVREMVAHLCALTLVCTEQMLPNMGDHEWKSEFSFSLLSKLMAISLPDFFIVGSKRNIT